jgi:hypothetical protein
MDYSTRYESYGFKVYIFWREEENMPKVCGAADVVLIRNFKVSLWRRFVFLPAYIFRFR